MASPRSPLRRIIRVLRWCALLFLLNVVLANVLLWHQAEALREALMTGTFPAGEGTREIDLQQRPAKGKGKHFRVVLTRPPASGEGFTGLELDLKGQKFSPLHLWADTRGWHLLAPSTGASFRAEEVDPAPLLTALRELGEALPKPGWKERIAAGLVLRPLVTGLRREGGRWYWNLTFSHGKGWINPCALPLELEASGWKDWHLRLTTLPTPASPPLPDSSSPGEIVPGAELAAGLAEAVRVASLPLRPLEKEPDGVRTSGKGWMETRGGHRQMYLEGEPHEIGLQHGTLAAEGIARLSRRLVYGVGLLYSIKEKQWFPAAARRLVERQRPFIAPAYFEEMRGVAEGANLPLDLIQAANIFPEFFHCSGVALMGEATTDGELLHARVLDYMVGVGLQDEAVVMAIAPKGARRFVTVGYLGFIGSVTGMNEQQVAIGEMGGAGQGDWDGIPMSLLIRQALETCDTLEAVERFMRESPRTCEYYYVISDGKGPSAIGVAATPTRFETFGPGVFHERLPTPVDNAVLLSGPGRYEKLVERVKEHYGKIDPERLIDIIRHPVAMRSNLHNVIFRPQSLRLSVADASRDGMACDQPYRQYQWTDLFPASAPR